MGERARTISVGVGAAALSLVLAVVLFEVRAGDLAVPIWYEGDSLFTLALAKGLLDHGGILRNPDVGAPYGLEFHDFPYPYGLHLATLRAIGAFTDAPGGAVNALWLLGFPAIAACAFAALRLLGLPRAESAAAAVLYAFLPYHLGRGEKHLFLSMYYLVPLAAALAVRLHRDAHELAAGPRRGWPRVPPRAALLGAVLALALGASGAYYAYFACFFFAAAGVLGALRVRSTAPLTAAAGLVILIVASAGAGMAPSLRYWREHGTNRAVAHRAAADAEIYGLRIAPILLPIPAHPIPGWAELRRRYVRRTPLRNEGELATLGVIGGVGFVTLVGFGLAAAGGVRGGPPLLHSLAALNLAGLLLATTSGFGALLARLGFRSIRAYNRISIFLAFFALAATIALARPLRERLVRTRAGAALGALLLALGLALGLPDVVSRAYLPDRAAVRALFASHRDFVRAAEAALPPGTAVFQLPHVGYPEELGPGRMYTFDPLRPYLHSQTLRWSHGAMKGRPGAIAIAALAQRPAAELPDTLAAAGYGALLVDRFGYEGAGEAALRAALEPRLGTPLESGDGRFLLYRLPGAGRARSAWPSGSSDAGGRDTGR
jgi:phosphoglycerol transferase